MTFEEIMPSIRAGKKFSRKSFAHCKMHIEMVDDTPILCEELAGRENVCTTLEIDDILADDWFVVGGKE